MGVSFSVRGRWRTTPTVACSGRSMGRRRPVAAGGAAAEACQARSGHWGCPCRRGVSHVSLPCTPRREHPLREIAESGLIQGAVSAIFGIGDLRSAKESRRVIYSVLTLI